MNLDDLNKVWDIKTLKKPGEDEARKILERIAKQVQPIMRKHKWKVKVLSEFCPNNPSILGLNVGGGVHVKLRLRYLFENMQPQYGETNNYGDVPPQQAQPAYVQQPIQGTQIQCGNCRGLMQIPPTCPPGSHVACPQCGTTLQVPGAVTMAVTVTTPTQAGPTPEQTAQRDKNRQEEETAFIFFVAGFFICCAWFGALFYWNSTSDRARTWARASLVCICIATFCILLPIIIAVSVASSAAANYDAACSQNAAAYGYSGCNYYG